MMEIKKLLLGVALVGVLGGQAIAQDSFIESEKISKTTHNFAFDKDGVLTENLLLDKAGLILKNIHVIPSAFVKHPLVTYHLLKNALMSKLMKNKSKPAACAEEWKETFRNLGKQNSFENQFAHFVQEWGQKKRLKPGMYELVKELHDLGYPISLYTNMGTEDDAFFAQKFPELYKLFKFRSCVSYKKGVPLIKKPSQQSVENFVKLNEQYNGSKQKTIFIDDTLKNCKAGQEFGELNWIHFKSPEQLRAILKAKGAFDTKTNQ